MPLPLIPLGLMAVGLYLLSDSKKGSGPGSSSGPNPLPIPLPGGGGIVPPGAIPGGASPLPANQGGGFLVEQDGVQMVRPDLQPWFRQSLMAFSPQPFSTEGSTQIVSLNAGRGADEWVAAHNSRGFVVLMSTTMANSQAPAYLASVVPGTERQMARVGSTWAVLAPPTSAYPATPSAGGGSPAPLPGGATPAPPLGPPPPAGPNVPANYVPGTTTPPMGDQPLPGVPQGLPPLPGGITPPPGGWPTIPGMPMPGGGAAPSAPTAPSGSTHILRSKNGEVDTAGSMAVWYTGAFSRIRELETTNPELRIVKVNGVPHHYEPWKVGQQVKLPPGWSNPKGQMPAGWYPAGTGGGGGGSAPSGGGGGAPGGVDPQTAEDLQRQLAAQLFGTDPSGETI